MRHLLFRTAVTSLVVTAALAASTAAYANDCFNPSRNPAPTGGAKGSGLSFNGDYANGASDELGGVGSQHGVGFCSTPNRDDATGSLHGIQTPEGCHRGD